MVKFSLDFLENPGYTDTMMTKETVMTKPMTKQGMIFECMNANADKPMDEVVALILKLKGVPGKELIESDVRGTYLWAIRTGKAKGVGKPAGATRAKSAKAPKEKAPKLIKPKLDKSILKDRKPITDKTAEEIADIRNKNLARLKAVGKKYAKGQTAVSTATGVPNFDADEAKAYVQAVTDDIDSFKSPTFLTMANVKALV